MEFTSLGLTIHIAAAIIIVINQSIYSLTIDIAVYYQI